MRKVWSILHPLCHCRYHQPVYMRKQHFWFCKIIYLLWRKYTLLICWHSTETYIASHTSFKPIHEITVACRTSENLHWNTHTLACIIPRTKCGESLLHSYFIWHRGITPYWYISPTACRWWTVVQQLITCIFTEAEPRSAILSHFEGITVRKSSLWHAVVGVYSPWLCKVDGLLAFIWLLYNGVSSGG